MSDSYIGYKSGADFAGAEELIEQEWHYLKQKRVDFDRDNIKAVALSGGGIRSASFCLGVMQALAAKDKLKKIDYLSTVSGGGYLGGSLSWLWSDLWKDSGSQSKSFGVGPADFPYGTEGRKFNSSDPLGNRNHASLLRHLRQNGKYLTPGHGISALSFLSIVLRSIVMGFVTLMAIASFIFAVFYAFDVFLPGQAKAEFFWGIAAQALLLGYLGLHFSYMVVLATLKQASNSQHGYKLRRLFETILPWPLIVALICYLFAAIHWVQVYLNDYALSLQVAGSSTLIGALFGAIGKDSAWRKYLSVIPHSIQMNMAAALMIFGLLVLADHSVEQLVLIGDDNYLSMTAICALLVTLLAYLLPINNISIHRYYRDRLMETFMPDVEKIIQGEKAFVADKANETAVHEIQLNAQNPVPYHLINTNIILVESAIAKFRGRGGDNFIISPEYSGSNATGWRKTAEFCDGKITLPTAVAISGAAANPDAGVAGRGLTTNVIISVLMSIFNLRLGYWASNPNPFIQPDQQKIPSYLIPGFWEMLHRNRMNEEAEYVQLSDGGHFENLALYELFRRRARLIIVCDAGADADYEFGDLANAIEKARVDFGVKVEISRDDLEKLTPATRPGQQEMDYPVAQQSHLLSRIYYGDEDSEARPSYLVYIKTTLSKNIGADIHGYKRVNPTFPDQTTADQFFDEVQFEAYRELGWQIAHDMMQDEKIQEFL